MQGLVRSQGSGPGTSAPVLGAPQQQPPVHSVPAFSQGFQRPQYVTSGQHTAPAQPGAASLASQRSGASLAQQHSGASLAQQHSGVASLAQQQSGVASLAPQHSGASLASHQSGPASLAPQHSGAALIQVGTRMSNKNSEGIVRTSSVTAQVDINSGLQLCDP